MGSIKQLGLQHLPRGNAKWGRYSGKGWVSLTRRTAYRESSGVPTSPFPSGTEAVVTMGLIAWVMWTPNPQPNARTAPPPGQPPQPVSSPCSRPVEFIPFHFWWDRELLHPSWIQVNSVQPFMLFPIDRHLSTCQQMSRQATKCWGTFTLVH